MAKKNSRKTSKAKPFWERGYQSHGYWRGKERLGTVQLGERGQWDGIYRWQAGNRAGQAKTLAEAKRAVEETVLSLASQLSLFADSAGD
jgi:squalene cyclase